METKTEVTADAYIIAGKKYARVTAIVRHAGLSDFSGIPEKDREYYFSRGTNNHRLWQDVEEGKDHLYDYDPEVEEYRAAHAKFLRETGFKALSGGIELQVKSDDLKVAGTLDRLGTIQNRVVLIDYKTTQVHPATAIQTALYLLCIPGYKFSEVERYGVAFRNNGTYAMSPRYKDSDKDDAIYYAAKYHKENPQ